MREFTVYFDIYGKKMKTKVIANSETAAKQKVIEKMVFIKVEVEKSAFNSAIDILDDMNSVLNRNDQRP